jgi:dipeptidase D
MKETHMDRKGESFMAVLEHLEPRSVFRFFEELCAIPHGSSNTRQISDWLMTFARERNLEAYQDELNNVIMIKEATPVMNMPRR